MEAPRLTCDSELAHVVEFRVPRELDEPGTVRSSKMATHAATNR